MAQHRPDGSATAPRLPSPARIGALLVGLLVLACLKPALWVPTSESQSVAEAALFAVAAWLVALTWVAKGLWSRRFALGVTAVVVLKIVLGLGHFYWVTAPAMGVRTSQELAELSEGFDTISIHESAQAFQAVRASRGLSAAVLGDYYRKINNPGVGVLYGVLYGALGPTPAASLPWDSFSSGLAALVVSALGLMLGFTQGQRAAASLATLLMPASAFPVPLYRDFAMSLLLVLAAYAAAHTFVKGSALSLITTVAVGGALAALRLPYGPFPLLLLVTFFALARSSVKGHSARTLLLVAFFLTMFLVVQPLLPQVVRGFLDDSTPALQASFLQDSLAGTTTERVLGGGVLGRAIYLLFAPMPWNQRASPNIMAYLPVACAQNLMTLGVFAAAFGSVGEAVKDWRYGFLMIAGAFVSLMPLAGHAIVDRYVYIGLPLLFLPTSRLLRSRPGLLLLVASGLVLTAHLAYWLLVGFA